MDIELKLIVEIDGQVDHEAASDIMAIVHDWVKSLDLKHPDCTAALSGTLQIHEQFFANQEEGDG